jgi:RNA polymerase sigma-70 factor (ECF subfamily)
MDSIYIRKVLDGDKHAFRYFIEQYRDMAYSLAISIVKNHPLAEEVTQDAFIKAYRALPKFEQRAKFSTWLYKIVTNEALKKVRKKSLDYSADFEQINDVQYSEINGSIGELAEQDQKYYINRVLDKMIPNDSLILRLFYLNENSQKEIMEITGFSATNIKSILHRARKRFYAILKEELQHEIKSII